MSNLTMALRLEPQYQEVMEHKWQRFTQFHSNVLADTKDGTIQDVPGGKPAGFSQPPGKAPKAKSAPKAKAKPKAKSLPRSSPTKSAGEDEAETNDIEAQITQRNANALKDLNKECSKIKTLLKNSQADGNTLLQAFANHPNYAWGKGNQVADVALQSALQLELSQFKTEYLTQSWQSMSKRYGIPHLTAGLESFKDKKEKVDKLANLVAQLLRMHAASRVDEATG